MSRNQVEKRGPCSISLGVKAFQFLWRGEVKFILLLEFSARFFSKVQKKKVSASFGLPGLVFILNDLPRDVQGVQNTLLWVEQRGTSTLHYHMC